MVVLNILKDPDWERGPTALVGPKVYTDFVFDHVTRGLLSHVVPPKEKISQPLLGSRVIPFPGSSKRTVVPELSSQMHSTPKTAHTPSTR